MFVDSRSLKLEEDRKEVEKEFFHSKNLQKQQKVDSRGDYYETTTPAAKVIRQLPADQVASSE